MKPRISVVIPCYNQAQYLPEAVESVLTQTLRPHEVIIVVDGSPDNSLAVAQSYEKYGVKVINQVNKGLASARNAAIMNMTGDYFMPLDADDKMAPNCIEKITKTIENNPNVDIVAPSFKEFEARDREIILMEKPTIEDFKSGNRIGYFSATKKEKLLEVGGYNPKMIWGYEDYDIWFDLLKRDSNLVTIPEVLILYRVKEDSMYTESVKHHDELMDQIRKNHPTLFQ